MLDISKYKRLQNIFMYFFYICNVKHEIKLEKNQYFTMEQFNSTEIKIDLKSAEAFYVLFISKSFD